MSNTTKRRGLLAALVLAFAALGVAGWQIAGGNVGAQTYAVQVLNAQAGTGPGAPVKNVGQSSHWLSYCTAHSQAVQIALEGSNDGVNWFQISNMGNVTGCTVVTASGYYQNVRPDIYQDDTDGTGTATVTAYYTASTFPISNTGVLDVGLQPQPVLQIPATPVFFQDVKSAFTTVSSTAAVVTDWYVYNPNATLVYAELKGTTLEQPVLRVVPPNSGVDVALSSGFDFPTEVTTSCSTTYPTPTDPTTGCMVSTTLRQTTYVNTLVNSSGAVQQRQQTGPH